MKVLYIEDNEINRLIFVESLKIVAEVKSAESGKEGLSLLEENEYDIIVIDINLNDPEMDGFDVLRGIISSGYREKFNPKIYALTAFSGLEWEKKCLDAGFDKYYSKPINPLLVIK